MYVHNCIKRKDYSIHGDIQLKYRYFFPINRLERQKERGDNFFDETKNYLRWILKGNRPKKFQISTIFTFTLELAIFRRENQKERQKERADNFFD